MTAPQTSFTDPAFPGVSTDLPGASGFEYSGTPGTLNVVSATAVIGTVPEAPGSSPGQGDQWGNIWTGLRWVLPAVYTGVLSPPTPESPASDPTSGSAGSRSAAPAATAPAAQGTVSASITSKPAGTVATVQAGAVSVQPPGTDSIGHPLVTAQTAPLTAGEPLAQLPAGSKVTIGATALSAQVPHPSKPGIFQRIEAGVGEEVHQLVDRVKAWLASLESEAKKL